MTGHYSEHEKVKAIQTKSQAIGEFLDHGPYQLCEWHEDQYEFLPVHKPIHTILAEWFGIDEAKLEAEKREMLEELRKANAQAGEAA